ncbi:MAG: Fic family protein [Prolixibacteraceae bacterium]
MDAFLKWHNTASVPLKGKIAEAVLTSASAHLYFESIHPFEDGNGRIGRAIAEKTLSQSLNRPVMLSLSRTIEQSKKAYSGALKQAQRSSEITSWIHYFTLVILDAQHDARSMAQFTLKKAQFFERYRSKLNERQSKAVGKMLTLGPDGFKRGMTARKYMSITGTSKATATRDLQQLHEMGAFTGEGGGRSVRYHLNL